MLDDLGTKIDVEQNTWSEKLGSKDTELSQLKQSLQLAHQQLNDSNLHAQVCSAHFT